MTYRVLTDETLQQEFPGVATRARTYADVLEVCLNAMERQGYRLHTVMPGDDADSIFVFHNPDTD